MDLNTFSFYVLLMHPELAAGVLPDGFAAVGEGMEPFDPDRVLAVIDPP